MKLLFDQNLPPRWKQLLSAEFPDSVHVIDVGLDSADDEVVWEYAKDHGLTIASKDSDFQHLAARRGPPPKAIWVRNRSQSILWRRFVLTTTCSGIWPQ